jgi:hypothetical protein
MVVADIACSIDLTISRRQLPGIPASKAGCTPEQAELMTGRINLFSAAQCR